MNRNIQVLFDSLEEEINTLEADVADRDDRIYDLEKELSEAIEKISDLEKELADRDNAE
jgi:predicted  nucleic acid-binding Zn-ribbon protein